MTNPTIRLFDKDGKVLVEAVAKSNAKRISMRLPAWQRQLDGMFVPGAITATIGDTQFKFDTSNRSQWVG